jgi:hypothetical protein
MKGTIDTIAEGVARLALDGGAACILPARALPAGAKEGDRFELSLRLLPAETERARAAIAQRQARLARDDDGGDFSL